jgi:hypothetical protein
MLAADTTAPHALTLATSRGRRLCKTRHADGTATDYDLARVLDLDAAIAPDLDALAALLHHLAERRDTCVLRGAILANNHARGQRRLLHRDPKTGDAPTMGEAARAWLALDLDGLPLPSGADPRDLAGCGAIARAALPTAFHDVACIVWATASHGFKPGARLRLWFLLSRALSGFECKRWLHDAPVDRSVFGAVQPIYTAAPAFIGMSDPLPSRLVTLPGATAVSAPSAAALAPLARPLMPFRATPTPSGAGTARYASTALARAAVAVARASEGARHPTAVAEAWGLARLVARGLLAEADMARALDGALQLAGKPAGEGAAIAAWAVSHRTGGAA